MEHKKAAGETGDKEELLFEQSGGAKEPNTSRN
jgi:hypothetical protein